MSVHLICLQHVRRDAARRAGLSATADPCRRLRVADIIVLFTETALIITAKFCSIVRVIVYVSMLGIRHDS